MKQILVLPLLLAACGPPPPSQPANQAAEKPGASAKVAPAAPAARAFSAEVKTDLIEFTFSWPAEAAAIPDLVRRFTTEMDKEKAELIAGAEEDKAMREKMKTEFHGFMATTAYETAGQSQRLLSLRSDGSGYTGGAHGYAGTSALLWDRQRKAEINFADLFADKANRDRLLTQRWCDALGKAREEKRGEPAGDGGMFDDCPALNEISIIPADSDNDGRFDHLLLVASPYVAGPWVEGAYEIELAMTPDLISGLKAEYRPGFEAQGAQ
jgi:hypothetical protein